MPQDRIVEKTVTKYVNTVDTFYINQQTTDTVFISVPVAYKQYNDTLVKDADTMQITVNYHGFLTEIDSISFKHKYSYSIPPPIKKGWTYGIYTTVGSGYDIINNKPYLGIGVGFGIGYSWHLKK